MKKVLIALTFLFLLPMAAGAQSIAYIESETIFNKMPQYLQAQQQLERVKEQYDAQIEKEYKKIELLFNNYQRDKARLSQAQRDSKEQEIISLERSVKELEQQIYGEDGLMLGHSKQYLEPLKEQVQSAIDAVAAELSLVLVFDLSTLQGVVFQAPNGDITPLVLRRLNLK